MTVRRVQRTATVRLASLGADDLPSDGPLPPPWPGRTVPLDGISLHVRDTPATRPGAEPALYVHGLGGSAQNFTDLAGLLADRLDGQAIDLPGFGNSEPGPRYTLPYFTNRVIRWIEHSGRGPVHLVGNSLGGAVSVRVAVLRPDLVRTLTLISPAMPFLDARRSLQAQALPLLVLPGAQRLAARHLARLSPEAMAAQVLSSCVADPGRISGQRRREAVEEMRIRCAAEHHAAAYVRSFRGLVAGFLRAYLPGPGSLWQMARRVPVPTLVISGRQDRLVDVRVSPQVARLIPDSRLLMLDGVGHVAQMEVPRVVARAVVALVDEYAAAGSRAATAHTGGGASGMSDGGDEATVGDGTVGASGGSGEPADATGTGFPAGQR